MMSRLLFVFILMWAGSIYAQTIVLKQSVPEHLEDEDGDFGPNRKRFSHPFTGFGFVVGGYDHENDTLPPVKFGNSFYLASGTRYYKNYNPILARVLDYEISYEQHSLNWNKQPDIAIPLDNNDIKKAKYWMLKIGLNWSYQFNLKPKRGNQLGTYFSIGAYGDYLIFRRFAGYYRSNTSSYAKNYRIALGRINYFNKWDYGTVVRFGGTNWSLFAKYRIANYFDTKSLEKNIKELPRFVIGLNLFPGNI